jgi:hypothetical protein
MNYREEFNKVIKETEKRLAEEKHEEVVKAEDRRKNQQAFNKMEQDLKELLEWSK